MDMCLAVPMKLISREGETGKVELGGIQREISLMLLPEAEIGEYVVVHAGFAIQKLDEKDAQETLRILKEMGDLNESVAQNIEGTNQTSSEN